MEIVKYKKGIDFDKIKMFLMQEYQKNQNLNCWLPERFEDVVFRIDVWLEKENGKIPSQNYLHYWEENGNVVAVLLPDGEAMYPYASKGYEYLFDDMVKFLEEKIAPDFENPDDILIITHDSISNQNNFLSNNSYILQNEHDFDNFVNPQLGSYNVELPDGFYIAYGEEILDDTAKSTVCHLGFHPDAEEIDYIPNLESYNSRKKSNYFKDSFEVIIRSTDELCSYAFCYVNLELKTAFIEPVSTRNKYQKIGLGKAMMHTIINRCKDLGITSCYVNSYDWRVNFYNKSGFETIDVLNYFKKEEKSNKTK